MNLLLQVGLAPDAEGDAEAWVTYLNREWPPDAQQKDEFGIVNFDEKPTGSDLNEHPELQ
ncbi:hypothetical protein PF010_g5514 [Phytophthora fragariae]|uniref:Uncharacterized protein n=1 Tax=Phytophthora fragariae TaxID=53985 RepID=A0A6A3LM17_9STRA|nr:hypothetical protein PF011_g5360 [Phytophthora fragariae]KAE9125732.1 hypothetical protein PF010_g5514 [Phytophthora fragariae]KAE9244338.1 hypothetical protein PF004_g5722 [Phytophthora fragariae]